MSTVFTGAKQSSERRPAPDSCHSADVDCKIADLRSIRATLALLVDRCHGDERPECPILDERLAFDGAQGTFGEGR